MLDTSLDIFLRKIFNLIKYPKIKKSKKTWENLVIF